MLSTGDKDTCLLRRLDIEILLAIIEMLRPYGYLRSLSLTCKWIREACMSTLFTHCFVYSYNFDKTENPTFLPRSLWPHVRVLEFRGAFTRPDIARPTEDDFDPSHPEEWLQGPARRLAATQRLGEFAKEALLLMSNLHTIRLTIPREKDHRGFDRPVGVAAHVLQAFLSTPHLRHFLINGPMCNPDDRLLLDITLPPTIPLESIDYTVPVLRPRPRTDEVDRHGVYLLLERAHDSLISLTLPGESVPLHCTHLWQWPRLRKLRLYGERPVYPGAPPLVMTLGRMPHIRDLSLCLAEPVGGEHQPMWPPALQASYGWYELERLEVAHPHPEDEMYAHLPVSLRHLGLRCWPRYYKHHSALREGMDQAGVQWTSPLLSPSEMLSILRKSDTPNLTDLELEFRADTASYVDVFRHIASSYPRLTILKALCYRGAGGADLSVKQIANALRGLVDLRLLMLHLDFQCLPDVTVPDM